MPGDATLAFRERYGPVAIVTGAASGIGRAFAGGLGARGLDMLLIDRQRDQLKAVAREVVATYGVRATTLTLDLAGEGAAQTILDAAAGMDVGLVISNAGCGRKGDHASLTARQITDTIHVNSRVAALLSHGFIPRLRARGRGGFLMVSSVEGLMGSPYSAVYAASKAFLNSLGEALWGEVQGEGIDILTLCPGATDTPCAREQGVDPSKLAAVASAESTADFGLNNLANGPVVVDNAYYRELYDGLLAMPRREALAAMAAAVKAGLLPAA